MISAFLFVIDYGKDWYIEMEGTWIEVRVSTISEALEAVEGIFYMLDCKGVAAEDPEDVLGREQGP